MRAAPHSAAECGRVRTTQCSAVECSKGLETLKVSQKWFSTFIITSGAPWWPNYQYLKLDVQGMLCTMQVCSELQTLLDHGRRQRQQQRGGDLHEGQDR